MQIIDGKKIAAEIKREIAAEVDKRKSRGLKIPHLAAILVGNDPSSEIYVSNKIKDCKEVGFNSTLIRFDSNVQENELIDNIKKLNSDYEVDGFIVQLPLPDTISENKIIESIDPSKDVDGFHPVNVGKMVLGIPSFLPATPFGIIELIKRTG
ncbi:MAG TPA: tetrahydrofolate dehydrogenase/cyclohydrolase catalytic domain-containing protein, partial [Bacteroidales bacterium]|nr:tetrahydrofolate dehydrogenase/cyclohydrolase catalytic domain-containing protein [Bacteroidales bacterium]